MFDSATDIILETPRLILKGWMRADADDLFQNFNDAEVVRYIADGKPFSIEKTVEFLNLAENYQSENGFSRWKIVENQAAK